MPSKKQSNKPPEIEPTADLHPAADSPPGSVPAVVEPGAGTEADWKQKIADVEAECQDLRQSLIRRQADFDNFRKRIDRDRREDRERAVTGFADSILPVLDNFERALAAHQDPAYRDYRRGFEMIFRQMTDLLAKQGIVRMENPAGKEFDPYCHEAVDRVPSGDYPEGTVIDELQAGYRFHNQVLRPAQVRVAVHPARVEGADA